MNSLERKLIKKRYEHVADLLIAIQGLYYYGLIDDEEYETFNVTLSRVYYSLTKSFNNEKE